LYDKMEMIPHQNETDDFDPMLAGSHHQAEQEDVVQSGFVAFMPVQKETEGSAIGDLVEAMRLLVTNASAARHGTLLLGFGDEARCRRVVGSLWEMLRDRGTFFADRSHVVTGPH